MARGKKTKDATTKDQPFSPKWLFHSLFHIFHQKIIVHPLRYVLVPVLDLERHAKIMFINKKGCGLVEGCQKLDGKRGSKKTKEWEIMIPHSDKRLSKYHDLFDDIAKLLSKNTNTSILQIVAITKVHTLQKSMHGIVMFIVIQLSQKISRWLYGIA